MRLRNQVGQVFFYLLRAQSAQPFRSIAFKRDNTLGGGKEPPFPELGVHVAHRANMFHGAFSFFLRFLLRLDNFAFEDKAASGYEWIEQVN